MAWTNNDGLRVRFGTEEGEVGKAGFYAANRQNERMAEFVVTLTDLADATDLILSDTVTIPNGARIRMVRVINEVAATSGGSATIDVGLVDQDRSTAIDVDGLLVDAPIADWNAAGETKDYIIGVTGVGALVGTTVSNTGLVVASYDTAAFTAGRIRIQVFYYVP